ncbi:MAG TPA: DnaA/Hda family protein [Longimicrobiaceae bacterium]|nr:DnaA/Hda family protein [Longimicrobiaceae bacterium]
MSAAASAAAPMSFQTLVVGRGNRTAAAAARRAAESPGTSYNPLVLYGASGIGKTHLLHAIADLALRVHPELRVVHETTEHFVDRIAAGTASGTYHFQDEHLAIDLLLLDDLEYLAGHHSVQAELLWIWDAMVAAGAQVVLVANRALTDLDGFDQRLLTQFPGGLVLDVAAPDLETRTAIVERDAGAAGVPLAHGVAEAVARIDYDSVAALRERLVWLAAEQHTEGRMLGAAEVFERAGQAAAAPEADPEEFNDFFSEIATTVAAVVEATPWRQTLGEAILRWEGEGYRTTRLEAALAASDPPAVDPLIAGFAADVARLRVIAAELAPLDPVAAGSSVLRDPDRIAEAEMLLRAARPSVRTSSGGAQPRPLMAAPRADFDVRAAAAVTTRPPADGVDRWFLNPEKIAWSWLALEDRLLEELD